jgi:hypothetical protein
MSVLHPRPVLRALALVCLAQVQTGAAVHILPLCHPR